MRGTPYEILILMLFFRLVGEQLHKLVADELSGGTDVDDLE